MKIINKFLITTYILLLTATFSFAQDEFKKVRLGITASGNVAWLKPDNNGSYGYKRAGLKIGYTAGVHVEMALFNSPNYAFLTGVNMLYHPGKLTFPDMVYPTGTDTIAGTTTATYKLNFIEVPLMLKLKTNEIGYLTYYGQVGTSVGVKYKARKDWEQAYSTGTASGTYTPSEQDIDISKETNLFRFPLILGAGVEYNLSGNTSILAGAVFSNGFTNAFSWSNKNNPKVYEIEENGSLKLDSTGNPILVDGKRRKAISNYIGLQVGIMF